MLGGDAMDSASVIAKTSKGAEEIEQRKYKLDAKQRSALIVVNGKQNARELGQRLAQCGYVLAMLDQLAKGGFVATGGGAAAREPAAQPAKPAAAPAAARAAIRQARAELGRAISAALGPDGDDI